MARRRQKNGVPLLEWIAGGVALVVVAGTIVFFAAELFRNDRGGPHLRVRIDSTATADDGGQSIAVVVRNAGSRAAADVTVEGTMRGADGRDVRSEVRIDYVPGLSERQATLVFPASADRASLALRVVGYTMP